MSEKTHILIVDDNPSMTKTLADILEAKGYGVYTAFSGKAALKILQKEHIDVLLTDVKMPDMNGVELYQQIKNPPGTILMTAYAADDIIKQGMEQGIKTVMTKPLDIDLLLTLIAAIADTKNMQDSLSIWT